MNDGKKKLLNFAVHNIDHWKEGFSKYKIGYNDKYFCCKCKGRNKVGVMITESGYIAECTTTCSDCLHEDYWAYGFYQSKEED